MRHPDNKIRNNKIIEHVRLFRLTVPWSVNRNFFSKDRYPDPEKREKKVGDTLSSLCRRKLLKSHPFPGEKSHRFYTLPEVTLEPTAIDYDLALLIWCTTSGGNRLTQDDLRAIVGEERLPHHHVRHCLFKTEKNRNCILRMYPSVANKQTLMRNLRKKHFPDLRKTHPQMVESGDLGMGVLVNSKSKKEYLEREINRVPKKGGPRLIDQVRIVCEVVPNSTNFHEWKPPK